MPITIAILAKKCIGDTNCYTSDNLAYHSENKRTVDDGSCRLCNYPREEFIHLATTCPRLGRASQESFGPLGPGNKWNTEQLLHFIDNPIVTFLMDNRKEDETETLHI